MRVQGRVRSLRGYRTSQPVAQTRARTTGSDPSAAEQLQQTDDDCGDQQHVDHRAGDLEHHDSKQSEHEQDKADGEQHGASLASGMSAVATAPCAAWFPVSSV